MNTELLTSAVAERIMRWTVCPDRFITGKRAWMPPWRFQPTERIEDAFRLLERAAPREYSIVGDDKGTFRATVRLEQTIGEAIGGSQPFALTCAIARACGIEVDRLDEV